MRVGGISRVALTLGTLAAAAPLSSPAQDRSAEAFLAIAPVFQSPRCMNCHTSTQFPRQGEDRHRHLMNVARGPSGHGAGIVRCSMCHQRANQATSGVPGADEDWHLPPRSMGWEGLSVAELCAHLIDPRRNGGRSGEDLVDHLAGDLLVRWAWNAGTDSHGKARPAPPLGYDDFMQRTRLWVASGAKCPG